jgi:heme/copper-type cytochrome/quinol oxidase subunit 3
MVIAERKAQIGMVFFLAAEAMFFAGLISAYWVLRAQVSPWPPPAQPRLPVLVTGINTLILIGSGTAFWQTRQAVDRGCRFCIVGWLGLAGLGGAVFLGVQGYEWIRLIGFGLTTVRNIYGGLFYIVIGTHAVHVLAGLVFLLVVFLQAVQPGGRTGPLAACRMYWTFVVGVWPVLYALVYF